MRDCAMPYGVYSIKWGVDYAQMHRGMLSIDWWDYGDSAGRIERVASRRDEGVLVEVLDA